MVVGVCMAASGPIELMDRLAVEFQAKDDDFAIRVLGIAFTLIGLCVATRFKIAAGS